VTFEEYMAARLPALLRFAVMLIGDPHVAEDVVQETMVKAYSHWRRVERAQSPDLYIRRMVTNTYFSLRRGGWWRHSVPRADVPDRSLPDTSGAGALHDDLWRRLGKLPPRQRAAVVLRFYEGLSDGEIAEVLGCAVGTVRSQISRALDSLRHHMGIAWTREQIGDAS
jgi:RNA polymerase sigma-70 factor (sigma-E family)